MDGILSALPILVDFIGQENGVVELVLVHFLLLENQILLLMPRFLLAFRVLVYIFLFFEFEANAR